MNILYIANLIPYPLDGGGKIFTYSTLQALSKFHMIDMVCFYEHEDIVKGKKALEKYCASVEVLPIRVTTRENMPYMMVNAGKSMFSRLPLGISKYIVPEMKQLIKTRMTEKKYDIVFLNILSMYGYFDFIKSIDSDIKVVLYEQNCEAQIYRRYFNQTKNIFKKIFLKIETMKLERIEQKAISDVDRLIVLSEEDRKQLGASLETCKVIPIGVAPAQHVKRYGLERTDKVKMLFVGTMTWTPNNEGIMWFLEKVMPLCKDANRYELAIVGKNPSNEVKRLCAMYDNVKLMGYVESLDAVYDAYDVLVVPLFIGSGQRVKIIEAFARGYAVISTSIGAEGLQYEDEKTILIADDEASFKAHIDKCFDRTLIKQIGEGGKHVLENAYSVDVIGKKLNSFMQ